MTHRILFAVSPADLWHAAFAVILLCVLAYRLGRLKCR